MAVKDILRLAPNLQALALIERNARLATKRKKKISDFVSAGTGTIVTSALIAEEQRWINEM